MNTIETPSTNNISINPDLSYRQMGANSAIQNMGAPGGIEQGLYTAYNRFIQYLQGNNQQLFRTEQDKKMALDNELERVGELCLVVSLNPLQHNLAVS